MNRRGGFDAIVVGAGVIGSASALALARDGFVVALVETHPPQSWTSGVDVDLRVVALAPDSTCLLDDLGVWRAIAAARASPYRRMRLWDALAPGELVFDAAERGAAALGHIVENRLVQHVLWQALADHALSSNVRVCCPGEVAAIEQYADSVIAVLADGTQLQARVLIAADGAQSCARNLLGIDFAGRDYEQRAVVAHVATERAHEDTAWQRFLPGGPLAFLPLADGRSSVVWSLPDAESARVLALDDVGFCAELGCAFDFRLGTITATTPRAAFPLRMRLAARYVAGRSILIGDAAHVVHPLAGQGMNLGLRDVACLRRVLGHARARGSDIGAAHVLGRYGRERQSENTLAVRGLDAIQRVFDPATMPLALLRGAGLGLVSRIAPLREFFASVAAGR